MVVKDGRHVTCGAAGVARCRRERDDRHVTVVIVVAECLPPMRLV